MRTAWLTDLHFDFATVEVRLQLLDQLYHAAPDLILVGGDTGESHTFADFLREITTHVRKPLAFVLGNHDYYRSSIDNVRTVARQLTDSDERLFWLPARGPIPLGANSALVGHGGWGDARSGDFFHSDVILNDYLMIDELMAMHRFPEQEPVLTSALQEKLHSLGEEAAESLRQHLEVAAETYQDLWVLMHVPPFREACWHEGVSTDDNWAPHFVCEAVGEMLVAFISARPGHNLTVLCGHTHSSGEVHPLPNLVVKTGGAVYGAPAICEILEFSP